MRVDILGRTWSITTLPPDAFSKRFDDNAAGITCPASKQIVINDEDINVTTVAHEVFHASLDGLCISAADLTQDQFEEVACELFAIHGHSLLKLAAKLTTKLRKRRR